MASIMIPEKKVFRARVLDPTKRLPIRLRQKCRTQSPKIKRAVAVPPSGMEKEEEMESHLQQAIYAQKATSAGVVVENHVIPTPKVVSVDKNLYEKIYSNRTGRNKKLTVFRDFVSFFLNQSVYDADSEDEEWLNTRPNIPIDQFEQIFVKLELSSQSDIIQPADAKALLQKYDTHVVDDVYDYWLQKRKQVASNNYKYSVLMPRLNTDGRRDDKTINPYIAFRRRLDKVQTRKKQKTEIQTYEKILRLNYAMKRSIALVEMMKQREKAKLALVGLHETIFERQYQFAGEENIDMGRISAQVASQMATTKFCVPEVPAKKRITVPAIQQLENGKCMTTLMSLNKNRYSQRRKIRPAKIRTEAAVATYNDENIIDDAWLKRNEELWNRITPTTAANVGIKATLAAANMSFAFSSTASLETLNLIGKYDVNSSVDGRYMFTRKFGCQYRAPTSMGLDVDRFASNSQLQVQRQNSNSSIPEKGELCKVIDGEPNFIAVDLSSLKNIDDEFAGYWPVLRRSASTLNHQQCRDGGSSVLQPEKQSIFNRNCEFLSGTANVADSAASWTNEPQKTRALGFIRRRMGRGGRVLFDLKF